jgi:predicted TIM-barrel fold metal-dependent hydrolase
MSGLIDTSVFIGHWPFRRVTPRDAAGLKAFLSARGVEQAWAASAEALLCPDPMEANVELFSSVKNDPFYVPVPILDISLIGWERDAQECLSRWEARAFKLAPNYHSYSLSIPGAARLCCLAREANVPVCIQVRMMDERGHHPLMRVPPVPAQEIAALARENPGTRFLACGIYQGALKEVREVENISAEFSFVESQETLRDTIRILGLKRIVFGSHAPLLAFESAAAKLNAPPEDVPTDNLPGVSRLNAERLLDGKAPRIIK